MRRRSVSLGFGRIGQLVSERAKGFGMHVIAYDPVVSAERYRELGVEKAETPDDVYAVADFLTLHLPKNAETTGWLNAEVLAKCKDGVRVLNVARGPLVVDADLQAALDSGKVAGAALDVFQTEPITEHPLFSYPNVIVTPHLGASTAEANDRAGFQAAEQIVAALTGGSVTTAVNIPAIPEDDIEALIPFVPLARSLGKIAASLVGDVAVDTVKTEFLGGIGERDTRLLGAQRAAGRARGAGHGGPQRGQRSGARRAARDHARARATRPTARDYTDLIRVIVTSGEQTASVAGTVIGNLHRPHLLEAWGQRFQVQLEDHVTLFRYRDQPGMLGRVGTLFGAEQRQHRLLDRRPPAGRRRRWQRAAGGDGDHHRRGCPGRGRAGDRHQRRLRGRRFRDALSFGAARRWRARSSRRPPSISTSSARIAGVDLRSGFSLVLSAMATALALRLLLLPLRGE